MCATSIGNASFHVHFCFALRLRNVATIKCPFNLPLIQFFKNLYYQSTGCMTGYQRLLSSSVDHIYLHKLPSIQQRRSLFFRRQRNAAYSIVRPAMVSPAHPVPKVV